MKFVNGNFQPTLSFTCILYDTAQLAQQIITKTCLFSFGGSLKRKIQKWLVFDLTFTFFYDLVMFISSCLVYITD